MLTFFAIILSLAFLSGLALTGWAFASRRPHIRPYKTYLAIVGALLAPLAVLFLLDGIFGLPAGSCIHRPINNAPLVVGALNIVLVPVVVFLAKGERQFAFGVALAGVPLTLALSLLATMSLAGCWI